MAHTFEELERSFHLFTSFLSRAPLQGSSNRNYLLIPRLQCRAVFKIVREFLATGFPSFSNFNYEIILQLCYRTTVHKTAVIHRGFVVSMPVTSEFALYRALQSGFFYLAMPIDVSSRDHGVASNIKQ